MRLFIRFIPVLIAGFVLAMPEVYGRKRLILQQESDFEKVFTQANIKCLIKSDIDLGGRLIVVGKGSKIIFQKGSLYNGTVELSDGCMVQNGVFKNVSFIIASNNLLKNCFFDNPNTNTCISSKESTPNTNITIDGCEFLNTGNNLTVSNSVHCIYVNLASFLDVKNCQFSNIGNLYAQKVSGISINTSNLARGKDIYQGDIIVKENHFNNLLSRENLGDDTHNTGEYHFIIVSSSENVLVKGNGFNNAQETQGYGKEPIYLKCSNSQIVNNIIKGVYSGEAVVCIKNYTKGDKLLSPKVDVIGNTIVGSFFAAVYHTGYGKIEKNVIVNSNAYAISCENRLSEDGHVFYLEDNTINLGEGIPATSTGTARAPITLLSYKGNPVKAVIQNNKIISEAKVETIRCRFAYNTEIVLKNNSIDSRYCIVSFTNLNGDEKSFSLSARNNKVRMASYLVYPNLANFTTFDVDINDMKSSDGLSYLEDYKISREKK